MVCEAHSCYGRSPSLRLLAYHVRDIRNSVFSPANTTISGDEVQFVWKTTPRFSVAKALWFIVSVSLPSNLESYTVTNTHLLLNWTSRTDIYHSLGCACEYGPWHMRFHQMS